MDQNDKIKRNLIIYIIGVLSLSVIGSFITVYINEIGGLIFIMGPIFMTLLLRFIGGDRWKDAGLGLKLKQSWRWYLLSIFLFPIVIGIIIGLGMIIGVTKINGDLATIFPLFIAGLAVQFLPYTVFALFEEWGWRGYMEPRLAALGIPDFKRHMIVGFIWSLWHIPLILSTNDTDIHYFIFFPLFIISVLLLAIVYGQIRKHSKTVWPCVIFHGISNTFAYALIDTNALTFNNKVLAYISPESLFSIVLWGIVSWLLIVKFNKVNLFKS
ncbi:CPBP family intramembrane glutamic endopeptidase [Chengkuizengella axinellae]|uniref:CPBP family intramembrane metalloprotease n=1 Tax=Chengkuizengella axinellae TaxID=3064388 RepID=A0ABT9IWK9_9BACL|nr:CPBP family intramembrane glutamic endopeptidase [Chengkuizengella sp. 2205SS18-9]MDP5273723.1 CPBP family intramembrane metalloprotease [Chengkuizengella sp. 2205SS18-9]